MYPVSIQELTWRRLSKILALCARGVPRALVRQVRSSAALFGRRIVCGRSRSLADGAPSHTKNSSLSVEVRPHVSERLTAAMSRRQHGGIEGFFRTARAVSVLSSHSQATTITLAIAPTMPTSTKAARSFLSAPPTISGGSGVPRWSHFVRCWSLRHSAVLPDCLTNWALTPFIWNPENLVYLPATTR
jgi:hypothetical protein